MSERHVLGLSGGKDSAALALYMRRKYPDLEIDYFFSDTGKELPEVYEFLIQLEGVLNKKILRLGISEETDKVRDFDWWLKYNGYFLPSPKSRWCTRNLKLKPFKDWIGPDLRAGKKIVQYVAIRGDETHREGLWSADPNLVTKMPFREDGVDKAGVRDILDSEGVGLPKYYEWRSRSGCTFCFFQQKIEWVNLLERHPDRFQEAMNYEKTAMDNASPFTWSEGESLADLAKPARVIKIKEDFEARRNAHRAALRINPLHEAELDIDEIYLEDEGAGACLICHK